MFDLSSVMERWMSSLYFQIHDILFFISMTFILVNSGLHPTGPLA